MRTPEEIKKGLECRLAAYTDSCTLQCATCLHYIPAYNAKERTEDVIAYIQQLEAQNAELVKQVERLKADKKKIMETAEILSNAVTRLERERDAAVKDISLGSRCAACKMFFHNGGRCSGGRYCIPMNFEWRGVPEPPKEDA